MAPWTWIWVVTLFSQSFCQTTTPNASPTPYDILPPAPSYAAGEFRSPNTASTQVFTEGTLLVLSWMTSYEAVNIYFIADGNYAEPVTVAVGVQNTSTSFTLDCVNNNCSIPYNFRAVDAYGSAEVQRSDGFYTGQFWISPSEEEVSPSTAVTMSAAAAATSPTSAAAGSISSTSTTPSSASFSMSTSSSTTPVPTSSTEAPSSTVAASSASYGSSSSATVIGAGVGGGVGGALVLLLGAFFFWRYRKSRQQKASPILAGTGSASEKGPEIEHYATQKKHITPPMYEMNSWERHEADGYQHRSELAGSDVRTPGTR